MPSNEIVAVRRRDLLSRAETKGVAAGGGDQQQAAD